MKRMIALVLSLVMALSLCVPAWGAGITNIGADKELPEGIPVPEVTLYTDTSEIKWGGYAPWSPTEGLEANLEAAFTFTAPHNMETVENCKYKDWYCDFYVKLDRDLGENQIFLGGNYGSFGWVGFHNGKNTLSANEELALLGSVTQNPWTYEDIASFVGEFICGVGDVDNALAGATFTVMLRLTNPENEAEFYNVATVEYIFDATPVAEIDGWKYATLQDAVDAADGETVKLMDDVVLDKTVTVAKDVTLDLAGYTVSGTCNASQACLIMVNNGASLTVKDTSAAKTGKITYAQGTSNVGWTIDLEGTLVLESGTIELTGSWSIGYAVDVRPNAWGTAYTTPTTFTMNGGKIISSDGAIRVASSSYDSYKDVSANFIMNDGEIDAAYDGLFIQQSDAIYDVLNVTVKKGKISSDLYTVRFYGDTAATGVVNGSEKPMTISLEGGEFSGLADNLIAFGGGKLSRDYMDFAIKGGYFTEDPSAYCAAGYGLLTSDKADYDYKVGKVVASVGTVNYDTLQAAVDAVADKGTITVKANGQSATVSAAKTFTVVYADGVTKANITAGSGYTQSEKDGVYTVTKYVAPYYPPVTETPTEKPAETPAEKPAQTPTQTPAAPAETPVEVVVPVVGNENTVKVEATVTGTTATVDKVDMAQLETVIGSDVDTGKVTIDFSTTTVTTGAVDSNGEIVEAAPVDTVQIPAEVIAEIAEAVADPENNAESLEVVLGDGASIEFDAAALAEKVAQAGGDDITISIKPTTAVVDTLSQAQIFTLGEAVAFDITVTSGGVEISDMGGNITISAPYELAEGETAEGIVVYYVDDAGNREKCETVYDAATGRVSWVTNHLSVYMVSYEAPVEDVTPDDGAVDETPVDDAPQGGSPVLWIVIAVVVIAAIVVAVVVSKKRKA